MFFLFMLPFVALLGGLTYTYHLVDKRATLDEARPADVIIVLGSAVWPGGRPSPSLRARMRHAVSLYRAGYAEYLILTGGEGKWPPSEAEVMRNLAEEEGIPQEALFLDESAENTFSSMKNAKAIMYERGWKSAIVVSDPFHMLRVSIMAEDLGIEAYCSPAFDSPTYTIPRLRRFYTLRESIALLWYWTHRAFQVVRNEE